MGVSGMMFARKVRQCFSEELASEGTPQCRVENLHLQNNVCA